MTGNYVNMKNQLPDISVITVNYNGFRDTCALLDALRQHLRLSYEVLVVDNGSVRDEAALLRERYPEARCIRSERNLGFAGGNNLGIREAKAEYLLFLNNDTYITDNSLSVLYETIRNHPELGGGSPKIKFDDTAHHIQFAGYTPLSEITLRNRLIGFGEEDRGQYDEGHPTPYLHGAAMLVRREVIQKAGEMPESYFLYYEELDWSTRMTRAGYQLWYEPRATVYHKESRTTGAGSPLKNYYLTRNRLLYAWRWRKGLKKWMALFYQWFLANPKNIAVFLLKGKFRHALACLQGSLAFIFMKNKKVKP